MTRMSSSARLVAMYAAGFLSALIVLAAVAYVLISLPDPAGLQ